MKKDIIEKMSVLITTAFGLVAALAWNGAIQAIFARIFKSPEGIGPMIGYAVVVTIVAVLTTVWIGKMANKVKS